MIFKFTDSSSLLPTKSLRCGLILGRITLSSTYRYEAQRDSRDLLRCFIAPSIRVQSYFEGLLLDEGSLLLLAYEDNL